MQSFLAKVRRLFERPARHREPESSRSATTAEPERQDTPTADGDPAVLPPQVAEAEVIEQPSTVALAIDTEPRSPEPQIESTAVDEELPSVAGGSAAAPKTARGALVLTLESHSTAPSTFTLTHADATLGRTEDNTIQLSDLSVSRRHARIAYRQGAYWLSDVGSMGGTWVDGAKISAPRRLTTGQVIDIGICRLIVSSDGAEMATDARPARTASQRRRS